jgi:hypothetical protein
MTGNIDCEINNVELTAQYAPGEENAQLEGLKKLRKEAAKMGAFIVLVVDHSSGDLKPSY